MTMNTDSVIIHSYLLHNYVQLRLGFHQIIFRAMAVLLSNSTRLLWKHGVRKAAANEGRTARLQHP